MPTLHERETYCSTVHYQACPTFLARLRKGRPLSEAEYLAEYVGDSSTGQGGVRL